MTHIPALAFLASLFLGLAGATPSLAADPAGVWLTQERDAQVRMTRCGRAWCGTLVWLREPKDPQTGRPVTDERNPDPARRSRPLVGTMIAIDFVPAPDAPGEWKGQFYNANDGNLYEGSISLAGAAALTVRGCLLAFCQTETWTRVKR